MEGIILDAAVSGSPVAMVCGVGILAIAIAVIVLGSVSDEEAGGRRVYWAEWPLPEAGPKAPPVEEKKVPRAA